MNLTKRQLICFSIAALIGVPLFFVLKGTCNVSFACMAMIVKDGQPFEVVAKHFIEACFIRPKIRLYQTDNYYAAMMREAEAEKEVERIVRKAEKRAAEPVRKREKR